MCYEEVPKGDLICTLISWQTIADNDLLSRVLCTGVSMLGQTGGTPGAHTGATGLPDITPWVTIVTSITTVHRKHSENLLFNDKLIT